ncbi:hypothetical protein [Methanobacterium formicicum]|uniref:Nucleotidyltransferase n=1 Tax=Methanobacterium formicicum (strain DSM 3637 / PP1) TaxID=1204725 RepID=K2R5S0_METFP|nr:hypothetical protein [Methanobacterium formicicum]EKF86587.1 hypothetical protein A994_03853 [Methanobacterium formicicum DSM 3637]
MAPLPSYFNKFLTKITLTSNQVQNLSNGHLTLRDRLENDEKLSKIISRNFLQGSYIRFTAIRPISGKRSDVDVIVVTTLDKDNCLPREAHDLFIPFLEKHYKDKYEIQGRSIGISLTNVDLDIVVTAAPSNSEEDILKKMESISGLSPLYLTRELESPIVKVNYQEIALKDDSEKKETPLYIPDREANVWEETNPLEQIKWTNEKNIAANGYYRKVVKALKWWRNLKYPGENPKSYPLEHFIGDCCPDNINSVAEGVTLTLENMANIENKPFLKDRGVPEHDVFGRLTEEEYKEFHSQVVDEAVIARAALDSTDNEESIEKWRELFGNRFPESLQESGSGSYKSTGKQEDPGGRFA